MADQTLVIRNGRIVRHGRIMEGDLAIDDGVISYIGSGSPDLGGRREVDAQGCYVMPGFVDLHVHGGCGFDLTSGLFDPETKSFRSDDRHYEQMLPTVSAHFARHGVSFAALASVASGEERLKQVLSLLADYVLGRATALTDAI